MGMSSSLEAVQPPVTMVGSTDKPSIKGLPFSPGAPAPPIIVCGPEPRRPLPTRVLLGTLSDFGFRLVRAVPIRVEQSGGSVVATWDEVDEFGTGTSTSAALWISAIPSQNFIVRLRATRADSARTLPVFGAC